MEKINFKFILFIFLICSLWINHIQEKQLADCKVEQIPTKVSIPMPSDTLDFNNLTLVKKVFDNARFRESLGGKRFVVKGTVSRIGYQYVELNEQEIARSFVINYNLRFSDMEAVDLQIDDTINCIKTISSIHQFQSSGKKNITIYSRD